jgi:BMFP domain-containing protein YqiC
MTSNHSEEQTHDEGVITSFMARLRQQIEAVIPEDTVDVVMGKARAALKEGFADFELVGRHELDAHLAALQQLTQTIKELEQRIARLESDR